MRKVIGYLLDYHRERFEWRLYVTIAIFLATCLYVNYLLDFEDDYIDAYYGEPVMWLWMFLFQLVPYLVVCLILLAFGKVDDWTKNGHFWLITLVGFSLLAFDRSFYADLYLKAHLSPAIFHFVAKCLRPVSSLITIMIPLLLVYFVVEKDGNPKTWYGLSLRKFDLKPYAFMLLSMSLIIGAGSFMSDIQNHYPRFMHARMEPFLTETLWPKWLAVAVYELCYGADFISVELFFRGFLIFAFTRILGPYAVLPMATTYCFYHFGKPLGEAIGSAFGGYILGIISLYSRNIWGGIMIHLGIAWLMELFGWMQKLK